MITEAPDLWRWLQSLFSRLHGCQGCPNLSTFALYSSWFFAGSNLAVILPPHSVPSHVQDVAQKALFRPLRPFARIFLLFVKAIEHEPGPSSFACRSIARLLQICAAIEKEMKTPELA
jgi:hypothetical protein